MIPSWRRFEKQIQAIFRRTRGAIVKPDARVKGKSGRMRRVELWVIYPFKIKFADYFPVELKIRIAVDCKEHKRPVGIKKLEEFLGQIRDLSAHAGILVSTTGFDVGARSRAKGEPVFLVDAPADLLRLARGLKEERFLVCKCCEDAVGEDAAPGVVDWRFGGPDGHAPIEGSCSRCSAPHVMCPDCGEATGFYEGEFGKWIQCPGGCRRLFHVTYNREAGEDIQTIGPMERGILEEGFALGGVISRHRLTTMMRGTKWQYAKGETDPLRKLEGADWIDPPTGKAPIRLTEEGMAFAEHDLANVVDSMYGW